MWFANNRVVYSIERINILFTRVTLLLLSCGYYRNLLCVLLLYYVLRTDHVITSSGENIHMITNLRRFNLIKRREFINVLVLMFI